ncbi:hypothetical protein DEJ16_13530 [Curtobacterium sp. MCJR17_055]|uniref:hypothetical protein n=1 Tax=unclassified Curtobacterium TaxID=257496 RepID=UPI000D88B9D4|nr:MULTISPECIES: hypothetical protein [unclassified Curtobacterium]PYY32836.1 hypothetical protein DEI87_13830 [Curtobacterium sp. MCBD17_029]PYY54090.1 hypothetical protein DEJ16_13530 [Curtobacterium sp. MCJR17_055]PYY55935.1 hypothetical protein DEJ26_14540 [Curtobacterium sp. MCPF17_015]
MPDTDVLDRLERTAVRTDADVVDLVVALLDAPVRRQCWVLFLGERGLPVHLVMPVADLPYEPDDRVPDFGALVEDVVAQVGAAQVVLAWERPGASGLFPVDWAWVDAMACTLAEHGVRLRGQVVVHEDGASMIELDDDEPVDSAA